jgi:hypothetical protein
MCPAQAGRDARFMNTQRVLAAQVWTYWFAPVLFVAAVVLDLGIAVLYVKRFVLPRLVVKMGHNEGAAVEHPVEMRPRRSADEQAASAA